MLRCSKETENTLRVWGLDQSVKDAVCFRAQDFFEYYQSSIARKLFLVG